MISFANCKLKNRVETGAKNALTNLKNSLLALRFSLLELTFASLIKPEKANSCSAQSPSRCMLVPCFEFYFIFKEVNLNPVLVG